VAASRSRDGASEPVDEPLVSRFAQVGLETQLVHRRGVDPFGKLNATVEPDLPYQSSGNAPCVGKADDDKVASTQFPAIEKLDAAPVARQIVDKRPTRSAVDLRFDFDVDNNTPGGTLVQMFAPCDWECQQPEGLICKQVLSFALLTV
jgi:hypothetical protein